MHIFDSFLMDNIISCLGRFINLRFEKNKNCLGSIKIIKSQLNKNTEIFLLIKYIKILYNLAVYDDEVILKQMFEEEIYKNLLELFPFDDDHFNNVNKNHKFNNINNDINIDDKEYYKKELKDLRIIILKTLGRILDIKDKKYIQKIIDLGFYQFLNQLLKFTDIKILKYCFYCIGSICQGTYGQIINLYDNNTISLAYIVSKNIYETINSKTKINNDLLPEYFKALNNIIFCFALLILNSLNEKLIPFINSDNYFIILLLIEGLKLFNDVEKNEELILIIFDAFNHLLRLPNNNFLLFLEQNGLKEIVDKFLLSSKESIVDKAQTFYDDYFDDGVDNNNKINIKDIIGENEDDDDN